VAVGTKSGEILVYDLASSSLIETVNAHSATIWSLHVRHDDLALVSGSADKDIKFWDVEWKKVSDEEVILRFPRPYIGLTKLYWLH